MMTIFSGTRTPFGCSVRLDGKPISPRLDLGANLATGFDWGSASDGAVRTALVLAAEVLRGSENADARALRVAGTLAQTLVAWLPHGSWRLTEAEIRAGVIEVENELRIREAIGRGHASGYEPDCDAADSPSRTDFSEPPPREPERASAPATKPATRPKPSRPDTGLLAPGVEREHPRWWMPTADSLRRVIEWEKGVPLEEVLRNAEAEEAYLAKLNGLVSESVPPAAVRRTCALARLRALVAAWLRGLLGRPERRGR